jgi:hypothetical protein
VDWQAVGTIVALAGVIVSLITLVRQLRQQKLLAVKKVEEEYLREILAVSDRLHEVAREYIDFDVAEQILSGGRPASLRQLVREYRRTLLLNLHVVRELRKRRFPRYVRRDESLAEVDRLAHTSITKYEELARRMAENPAHVDHRDMQLFKDAYAADFVLRVPIAELIAALYTTRREWKKPKPRFS